MDNGIAQEVQFRCDAPDHFELVVNAESKGTTFPLCGCDLTGILRGDELSVASPEGTCRLYSAANDLMFAIHGNYNIEFSIPTKQLEVLARKIGLHDESCPSSPP
jgi:hypothetical protein